MRRCGVGAAGSDVASWLGGGGCWVTFSDCRAAAIWSGDRLGCDQFDFVVDLIDVCWLDLIDVCWLISGRDFVAVLVAIWRPIFCLIFVAAGRSCCWRGRAAGWRKRKGCMKGRRRKDCVKSDG